MKTADPHIRSSRQQRKDEAIQGKRHREQHKVVKKEHQRQQKSKETAADAFERDAMAWLQRGTAQQQQKSEGLLEEPEQQQIHDQQQQGEHGIGMQARVAQHHADEQS